MYIDRERDYTCIYLSLYLSLSIYIYIHRYPLQCSSSVRVQSSSVRFGQTCRTHASDVLIVPTTCVSVSISPSLCLSASLSICLSVSVFAVMSSLHDWTKTLITHRYVITYIYIYI